MELGFSGCLLGSDDDSSADLRVYEVGPAVERLSIYVRPHPDSVATFDESTRLEDSEFFFVAEIGGGVTDLDLDAITGQPALVDAVLFEDDPNQGTGTELAWGADVDAVEILYPVDEPL